MDKLVEDIKAGIDIITALQTYTTADISKLRGKAKGKICCPFHTEKSPSFLVDIARNTWHCYGLCGVGGDVINLYATANGVSNKEAISALGTDLGLIGDKQKLTQSQRKNINNNRKKQEAITATKEESNKVYDDLCEIYRTLCKLIQGTTNIEELESIAVIVDDKEYINCILDGLIAGTEDKKFLKYAKEEIKRW